MEVPKEPKIFLPSPAVSGQHPLEGLVQQRRSTREYQHVPLRLADVAQLLWAAQGITHPQGLRTAPSAGALYPLEIYLVVGQVNDLAVGVYHYHSAEHRLTKTMDSDTRQALAQAAYSQNWLQQAAAVLVIAAVYERTTIKYGQRGIRYVHMESGHAAQNVFLQAEALGLGTVVVGAFDDAQVAKVLQLPHEVQPLMLMPIGRKAGT